jgi:hypothetical protein
MGLSEDSTDATTTLSRGRGSVNMIARVDSVGLIPLKIAERFAETSFDERREVDVKTFGGVYGYFGFVGSFRLVDGVSEYGIRWFKRRGRLFVFYTRSDVFIRVGKLHAGRQKRPDWRGETLEERVSYLDGYLSGIPGNAAPAARRLLETDIYTRIESLLYDGG